MSTWYVPALMTSLGLRRASLLNVGSPAVRIHTWNSYHVEISGRPVSFVYPSGNLRAQFGGGTTWSTVYVVLPNLAESEDQAILLLLML
jgi:hypothetical protein